MFRVANDTKDHLAWVQKASAGSSTQTLSELSRRDGKLTVASSFPSAYSFMSIAAADSPVTGGSLDGNWELVAGRLDPCYPLVMKNLASAAGTPNFSLDTNSSVWGYLSWYIPLLPIGGAPTSPLAYTDVSQDGLPDLLVPVYVGASGNHVDFLHGKGPGVELTSSEAYDSIDILPAGGALNLDLKMSNAYSSTSGSYPPSGANALEIVVWKETGGVIDPSYLAHWYYLLPGTLPPNLKPIVPIPESSACFSEASRVYWLETRYAIVDTATGKISKSWESNVAYLTSNMQLANTYFVSAQSAEMCAPSVSPPCPGWGAVSCDTTMHGGVNVSHSPALVTRRSIAPGGSGVVNLPTALPGTLGS
jgi:hypothetical protein